MFWGHGNNLLRCKNNKEALNRRESSPYIISRLKDQLSRLPPGFEEKLHRVAKLNLRFFYPRGTE